MIAASDRVLFTVFGELAFPVGILFGFCVRVGHPDRGLVLLLRMIRSFDL
jgi:hypothetical protein